MNWEINVRSYFIELAPKSGQSMEVCNRAIDVLIKSGVSTMRELAGKNEAWIFHLFLGERGQLDEECHDLVRDMQNKYLVAVQKAELLAAGANGIETYFKEHAPVTGSLTNRAINALRRAGIETMYALCATSMEELKGVRDLGEKSLAVALQMREKYTEENIGIIRQNE